MGGINIVLFVVLCSVDSLSCTEVSTAKLAFAAQDECRHNLEMTVAAYENADRDHPRAMGRCRYLLSPESDVGMQDQAPDTARVQEAFRVAETVRIDQETLRRLKVAARKADRLASRADCARQTWPHFSSDCLATAARRVRSVTVEFPAGTDSSMLVRLPARQAAGRD